MIEDNAVVLFQGDSVTDVGRGRETDDLGQGYPMMIASWFAAMYPARQVTFLNRGTSGDRARDLVQRWREDCLDLSPTWVSILIGINDCWRRFDSNDPTPVKNFEDSYRNILEQTKANLNARIILCEPFVLPIPEDRKQWREDLDPKIQVVRDLAREFDALLVPLDGIFAQASTYKSPEFWTPDGVHPSPAGHALIAKEWLETVVGFVA